MFWAIEQCWILPPWMFIWTYLKTLKIYYFGEDRRHKMLHTHAPMPPRIEVHSVHNCWDRTKYQAEFSDPLFPSEAQYALFTFPPLLMTGRKISRYKIGIQYGPQQRGTILSLMHCMRCAIHWFSFFSIFSSRIHSAIGSTAYKALQGAEH